MRTGRLGLAVVAATLGVAGCRAPTCAHEDYACIYERLRIYDKQGQPLQLVKVPIKSVKAADAVGSAADGEPCDKSTDCCSGVCKNQVCGGRTSCLGDGNVCEQDAACCSGICSAGFCENTTCVAPPVGSHPAPRFTTSAGPFSLPDRSSFVELSLGYLDACGARPGGCFPIPRKRGPLPGPFWGANHTDTVYATPAESDGDTSGVWDLQIGFDFEPEGGSEDLTFDLYPFSNCDKNKDAAASAASGGTLYLGQPLSVDVTVGSAASSSGSGSGSSGGSGGGLVCPDGSPCNDEGHQCCDMGGGSYQCLLPGLCGGL